VKVLIDPEKLSDAARSRSDEAIALEQELDTRAGGGAYMLRRRLERHVRELADSLSAEVAQQVHARLQDWAIDAVTRPPQNRELSGHEGEMLLNAAYLVEADRLDELHALVSELEAHHRELGARIELTGPWPPYNFVPGGGAETIA
jgi:23S rRNA A2030 N6-methylase RlmJ